jgi:hypothetical protein
MLHDKPIFSANDFKTDVVEPFYAGVENRQHKVKLVKEWQQLIVSKQIYAKKEEELQTPFLHTFFGEILGYPYQEHLPTTQIRVEVKTEQDQSKADGALGFFVYDANTQSIQSEVKAVIELKDAHTDLDKPQRRKDFKGSPVEQAFAYVPKFGGSCQWVIVSNFVEIRLYHASDSIRYEEFLITELFEENPIHKISNFKKLLFLLQKDRLFLQNSDSPTDILFADRRAAEISITQEFYNNYRQHRENLFRHIQVQNPQENAFEVLSATQKIMDRLLFMCFVRDTVPMIDVLRDSLQSLTFRHSHKDTKLWEILQELFVSFDKGYSPSHVPDFNGGLFKADELIDRLVVRDSHTVPFVEFLLQHDFLSELNVSILGHIFEQSITDLEELRTEIAKLELNAQGGATDTQLSTVFDNLSKRKRDGIFYTPNYITQYILDKTIGEWLEEKKQALLQEHGEENAAYWRAYEQVLRKMTVLDPACGSGAFLTAVFEYIWAEWKIVLRAMVALGLRKEIYRKEEWRLKKEIVLNNIFGVDLNRESVEISKLSLWLQTANAVEPLSDLTNNIKQGNSLIDDKNITPLAFDWAAEFPQVFENQGFDIVVGNPPYVNIELIPEKFRRFLLENYRTCQGRTDLYVAFIEKARKITKQGGMVSFIIPYAFTNQNYGEIARKELVEQTAIREITDFSSFYIFKDAVVKNIVLRFQNSLPTHKPTIISKANSEEEVKNNKFTYFKIEQTNFLKLKSNRLETKNIYSFLDLRDKICKNTVTFEQICFIAYGARLNDKNTNEGKDKFIHLEKKTGFKPFLEGKNIDRYYFSQFGWLDYQPDRHYNAMFPELFENEKIMFLRIVKDKLRFAYDNQKFYNSHNVINCVRYDKLQKVDYVSVKNALQSIEVDFAKNYDYMFLLGLLNSRLITWFFNNFLSDGLNFYPNYAKKLPIIQADTAAQAPIIDKVSRLLNHKAKFVEFQENVLEVFKADFAIKKISNRLHNWHLLSFKDFTEEITKCGGKITSKQRFDYIPIFKEQQSKAVDMAEIMTTLDHEIDNLVYKLYNLSATEIAQIEDGSTKSTTV